LSGGDGGDRRAALIGPKGGARLRVEIENRRDNAAGLGVNREMERERGLSCAAFAAYDRDGFQNKKPG
jgi:hypothetical protein